MILAIDFDGTVVDHEFPKIGRLRKDAKTVINKLFDDNHKVIIWTCRGGEYLDKMREFLDLNDIHYNHINENCPSVIFSPFPKIYADIYIDDRQIGGLPEWSEIYKIIKELNHGRN